MRSKLPVAAAIVLALAGLSALLAWCAFVASQQAPDFYRRALASDRAQQAKAGDQFERQVLQLHNEARRDGRWQAVLSDDQINGWLAADLPEKFPAILPAGLRDPRVEITPERIRIACRYEHDSFSAVVSMDVETHLTETPNVVAICLRRARAGAVPIPLQGLLENIRASAQQAELRLQWAQHGGDPVVLLTVPSSYDERPRRTLRLEAVELRQGQIVVTGRTDDSHRPQRLASPQGAGADQSAENQTRHR